MTAGHYGFVAKAKKPTRGRRGDPGRFVTLKSGRVIFIPEGKRTKWADVRDKVLAGRAPGKMSDSVLRREVTRLLKEYDVARAQNDWAGVGRVRPELDALAEEEKLRHFAREGWRPKGMTQRAWRRWKADRGIDE